MLGVVYFLVISDFFWLLLGPSETSSQFVEEVVRTSGLPVPLFLQDKCGGGGVVCLTSPYKLSIVRHRTSLIMKCKLFNREGNNT